MLPSSYCCIGRTTFSLRGHISCYFVHRLSAIYPVVVTSSSWSADRTVSISASFQRAATFSLESYRHWHRHRHRHHRRPRLRVVLVTFAHPLLPARIGILSAAFSLPVPRILFSFRLFRRLDWYSRPLRFPWAPRRLRESKWPACLPVGRIVGRLTRPPCPSLRPRPVSCRR